MKVKDCKHKSTGIRPVAEFALLAGETLHASSGSLKTEEQKSETWLTSEEAASHLGISVGSLRNRVSYGEIPRHKFGRLNRFLRSELDALLNMKGANHGNQEV